MAFESTAINELIAGVQQKTLSRDSSEWLCDERDEATEIDSRMVGDLFLPEPGAAPAVAPVPVSAAVPAYPHIQLAAFEKAYGRSASPTTHVHAVQLWAVVKKLALPIAIISFVSIGLGVYFATTDDGRATPAASAAAAAKPVESGAGDAKRAVAAAPAVEPTVEVAAEPAVSPEAEPTVDDVRLEVSAEAVEVTPEVTAVATPEATANQPATVAAADRAAAPAPAPETPNVEPGSPASRFLAPPPVEATIPTVAAKPAPAPTTVEGLVAPAAEEPTAKPAPREAKQSDREPREERRAAAPRAKPVAAKARAKQRVAVATEASAGKGILSIASTPSMEVWVNGRNSRAMTPIRIKLRAGKHVVTLIDKQQGKSRSFPVVIKPDETTKVTKSYD